jgi:hypothetical protein
LLDDRGAPRSRSEEERAYLQPLPSVGFDCRPIETRRVLREAVIAYEGNRYSVPAALVGDRVTVKEDFDGTLHVYKDTAEVASHPKLMGRGGRAILPEHHAPLWRALKQLGQGHTATQTACASAEASLSLWRPAIVAVERRPLAVYEGLLEGRC